MCKSWGWITSIYNMVPWQNPISFLFLPPYSSGLCLVRAPLIGDAGIFLPLWPFHLLRQLLCSALEWVHWLHNMTMTDDTKFISFLAWLPMSFKLVGYCIICWCFNDLLHFITVTYSCCKSNSICRSSARGWIAGWTFRWYSKRRQNCCSRVNYRRTCW